MRTEGRDYDHVTQISNGQFPVSRSLLSPDALARALETAYGLSDVRCRLIKATVNDVYRVDAASGPHLLRIHRANGHSLAAIAGELDLLDSLQARGLAVGPAVRQQNGERVLTFRAPEGPRHAALFAFVPGELLSRTPDQQMIRRYARVVARLHLLTDGLPRVGDRPRWDFDLLVTRPIAAIERVIARPDDVAYLKAVAARLQPIMAAFPMDVPAYGLVHGDLIPSNALVGADGAVALIDFDFYGLGWRAYDLVSYLAELRYWQAADGTAQAFLDEYQRIRPLAAWELAALPALEAARTIFTLGIPAQHVDVWGSAYLTDRMVDTVLDGVRQSMSRI